MHPLTVSFYVPSAAVVGAVPQSIQQYWSWIHGAVASAPAPLPDGMGLCTWLGPYNWTIQTFIYLRDAGFPCRLVDTLPAEGIIVAHGDFLPARLKPTARQFVVEIKPDRALHCRFANYVVVQNAHDPLRQGVRRLTVASAAVNYWTQPGLIPRDPGRGDRFENARFIGNVEEMLPDHGQLEAELARLGMSWRIIPRAMWHDYSDVDVVVAVRPVDDKGVAQKPASKLANAWLAGVPAVLSPDVAFEALRQSPFDFLVARTVPEIVQRVTELRNDISLRRAMVDNGVKRSREIAPERSLAVWETLLRDEVVPRYERWTRSPIGRARFFASRQLAHVAGRAFGQ